MADVKVSALTAASAAAKSMLIPVVEDPSGTPVSKKLTITQLFNLDDGTKTSSAPILDLAQTWNSGGVTFTALKLNVTDTASTGDSNLMELARGGNPQFQLGKSGRLKCFTSTYNVNTFLVFDGTENGIFGFTSNTLGYHWRIISDLTGGGGPTEFTLGALGSVNWRSTNRADSGSNDVILVRDAANTLAQRNGTAAQAFRLYNTYTDGSNYERGVFDWQATSNVLTIGTQKAGTGSTRAVQFVVGGTSVANFATTGHLIWNTDNNYDIGASGETRPRNVYVGTNVNSVNFLVGNSIGFFAWNNRGLLRSPSDGVITLSNFAEDDFARIQLGGTTSSFPAIKRVSAGLKFVLADDSASAAVEALSVKTGAPSGGTAGVWKMGVKVVSGTSSLNTGEYVELDIGGTLVKLATVTNS